MITFETEIKRWELEYQKLREEAEAISRMLEKKPKRKKVSINLEETPPEKEIPQPKREVERTLSEEEALLSAVEELSKLAVDEEMVKEVEARQRERGEVKDYLDEIEESLGLSSSKADSSPKIDREKKEAVKKKPVLEFDEPVKEKPKKEIALGLDENIVSSKRKVVAKRKEAPLELKGRKKKEKKVRLEELLEREIEPIANSPQEKLILDIDLDTGEVKVEKKPVEKKKPIKKTKEEIRAEIRKLRMMKKLGEITEEEYKRRLKDLKKLLEELKAKKNK